MLSCLPVSIRLQTAFPRSRSFRPLHTQRCRGLSLQFARSFAHLRNFGTRRVTCSVCRSRTEKNDTEESIPLLPALESLLLEIARDQQVGWILKPLNLQIKLRRRPRQERLSTKWVSRIISRIGAKAGMI